MGFLNRLFGGNAPPNANPPASRLHSQISSGLSQQLAVSQGSTRRELLRVVLRDTLNRHGIPTAWIAAELLTTTSRQGERGLHWRLHVLHWDPRLLTHAVALQNALIRRVLAFDPLAANWLKGISWQFALEDESECPPLPHAGTWMQPATRPGPQRQAEEAAADVIAGPVHIADDVRAELSELLKLRDEDVARAARPGVGWASTEPAKL